MHIKRMHEMIEQLTSCAETEFSKGLDCVDTDEMGKVIDMIKDLASAEYHARISKAMEKAEEEENEEDKYMLALLKAEYGEDYDRRYYDMYRYKSGRFAPKGHGTRRGYSEPYYHQMPEDYRDWERRSDKERMRDLDRMQGRMYYTEPMSRDMREGKSGISRRTYMETKEMHRANTPEDKNLKVKELENYLKELSEDVTEMLVDMTPEERTLTKTKLTTLISKM